MLSTALIAEIDRLLREGELSQRKIADRLGVSRGTISAIASGRRGLHGKEYDDDEPLPLRPTSPPARCPRCGYRVYMPCLICRARQHHERQQLLRAMTLLSGRSSPNGSTSAYVAGASGNGCRV